MRKNSNFKQVSPLISCRYLVAEVNESDENQFSISLFITFRDKFGCFDKHMNKTLV